MPRCTGGLPSPILHALIVMPRGQVWTQPQRAGVQVAISVVYRMRPCAWQGTEFRVKLHGARDGARCARMVRGST